MDERSGDESLGWAAREKLLNVTRQEEMEGLVDLIHSALRIELPDFLSHYLQGSLRKAAMVTGNEPVDEVDVVFPIPKRLFQGQTPWESQTP